MTIRGRFRTTDPLLGRCVHVDESAGDAAPLLPEAHYAALGGSPRLDDLPAHGTISRENLATRPGTLGECQLALQSY